MKVTPSTILDAPSYYTSHFNGKYNTDRCLVLRDLELEYDDTTFPTSMKMMPSGTHIVDLTNNSFTSVPPLSGRSDVHTLLLSRNNIHAIDGFLLPNQLRNLTLAHNGIETLDQLNGLKSAPNTLENLSLKGNNVCYIEGYREYVLQLLPQLRVLDFSKVKAQERLGGEKLSINTLSASKNQTTSLVKTPADKNLELMGHVVAKLDKKTVDEIKEQLANATTLSEIERLEKLLSGNV